MLGTTHLVQYRSPPGVSAPAPGRGTLHLHNDLVVLNYPSAVPSAVHCWRDTKNMILEPRPVNCKLQIVTIQVSTLVRRYKDKEGGRGTHPRRGPIDRGTKGCFLGWHEIQFWAEVVLHWCIATCAAWLNCIGLVHWLLNEKHFLVRPKLVLLIMKHELDLGWLFWQHPIFF